MADLRRFLDEAGAQQMAVEIKAQDAKTLESAKAYTDSKAKNYDAAGSAATAEENAKKYADEQIVIVNENLGKKADKTALEAEVTRATEKEAELQGNIDAVSGVANQNKTDIAAINNETTGILAQAKADATEKANAVQANVDALNEKVGNLPEGTTAKDVVDYVNIKTAGIATDAALGELQNQLSGVQGEVTGIKGDYLKAADKTELEGKISTAQGAADAAQSHSEGVASDLATETSERKTADEAQVARIAVLEDTITGLSGAMHFRGVKDEVPTDVMGYSEGDTIIVGNKEYVFDGTEFKEFGDASVNAEAITALTGRVGAAEGKITALEGEMDAVEGAVATKAEQSSLDKEIEDREAGDAALDERLQAVEAQLGDGENSVSDLIATAKQEAITAATEASATDTTTKANKALEDAKKYADAEDAKIESRVDALEGATHTHTNKALLDTYTQTEENLADAVAKKHEHANKAELDKIADGDVAKWNSAESNAKAHADSLNTAMTSRVDGIDGRVTANTNAVATKAEADDLDAAVERIDAVEVTASANASAIAAITSIPVSDVTAMFA